jgi:ribosomal protein S8
VIRLTKKSLLYVKTLYRVGAVKNYIVVKGNHGFDNIILSPAFYKNAPFYKNIRYVSTPSKKHTVSLKALRLLQTALRASILVLSTPYGLVTHKEAIKLKTGGIIICALS